MAAKYQLITELYRRTGKTVTRNPQAWQNLPKSTEQRLSLLQVSGATEHPAAMMQAWTLTLVSSAVP